MDERPHYDVIQKVVEDRRLPRPTDLVSPEVQAITDGTWPRPSPTDRTTNGLAGRSYEAIQPPLYHLVAAPSFAVARDHRTKVFVVRAFDLGLLLASAWLVWRLARRLAPREEAVFALALVVPVLLWPGVVVRGVTIGTTPLELVLVPVFLATLWRAETEGGRGRLAVAAGVLGLCLVTKLALLYLVPLFLLVVARRLRDAGSARARMATLAIAAVPGAVLAPWFALNLSRYGALTVNIEGDDGVVGPVTGSGMGARIAELPRLNGRLLEGVLPQEFDQQLTVWWVRAGVDGVALALLVGALVLLAVGRRDRRAWFLALPFLSGVLLMNATWVLTGNDTFLLRYVYATLPALALGAGLALARPGARRRAGLAVAVASLVVLAALWIDMAGAFYFTDVGDRLGI